LTSAVRCLACGEAAGELWASAVDVEYETTADRFEYWLCGRCDCLVIDPVPSDRLDEIYPPSYYSFAGASGPLDAGRNPVTRVKGMLDRINLRRALREVDTDRPAILDVGGGTGAICASLIEATGPGATGTVVDFDPGSAAVAEGRGLEAVTARFEDYEPERQFDLVLMLNLIEHVEDPIGVMRKAAGLLAPGGIVWIQTPNFRALDARVFRDRNWAGLHCPRHWVIFSADGLPRALGRAGLEVVRLRRTQGGAFWAASILGSLRRRRPGANGRPLVNDPLFLPLAAGAAAFDICTGPLRQTSQVVCLARSAAAAN